MGTKIGGIKRFARMKENRGDGEDAKMKGKRCSSEDATRWVVTAGIEKDGDDSDDSEDELGTQPHR